MQHRSQRMVLHSLFVHSSPSLLCRSSAISLQSRSQILHRSFLRRIRSVHFFSRCQFSHCRSVCLNRIGFCSRSMLCRQTCIQCSQEWDNLFRIIGFPKLQICTTLQQFTHTFRFFHTRHLHHNTSHLSFQCLDIGLYHTETVDTCTEHIIRIVNGRLYFGTQHFLYFRVGTLGRYFTFQLLRSKQFRQISIRCQCFVLFHK